MFYLPTCKCYQSYRLNDEFIMISMRMTSFEQSYTVNYGDVIMSAMASQITGVSMICSTVCSGADQRKHQSSAPLAFVRGIHRWPVNSPHKGPVTRKIFPFDDVIMVIGNGINAGWCEGSNTNNSSFKLYVATNQQLIWYKLELRNLLKRI